MKHVYGPVPSRRLGLSLGVDLVPYKICSYDCIYCQLGATTEKTVERKEYFPIEEILTQVREAILTEQRIDYITLSGSGEPTLNSGIGTLIGGIKKVTDIPVAVITNGSLLFSEEVRESLKDADLVIPSLDAANEKTFQMVNHPHPEISFQEMIDGLATFARSFKREIFLEIMLVKGFNDDEEEIRSFRAHLDKMKFSKIQLNTVVRPPGEKSVFPLHREELVEVRSILGEKCEIIMDFKNKRQAMISDENEKRIMDLLKRRPVTVSEISVSLGINRNEVIKWIDIFRENGEAQVVEFREKKYYRSD
jgi:wyosine [tRNA(Phe)-imidazoG37] synthetase (radical SAM superfamily)